MSVMNLGLLLMDSLDAAYRHATYDASGPLADWGVAVLRLVRRAFPGQDKVQEQIWDISRRVLWDLACGYSDVEELTRHFLRQPEAFFQSVLMVWAHQPEELHGILPDPSTLQ